MPTSTSYNGHCSTPVIIELHHARGSFIMHALSSSNCLIDIYIECSGVCQLRIAVGFFGILYGIHAVTVTYSLCGKEECCQFDSRIAK